MLVKPLINTTYKNYDFKYGQKVDVSFTKDELISFEEEIKNNNMYIKKVFEFEELETKVLETETTSKKKRK